MESPGTYLDDRGRMGHFCLVTLMYSFGPPFHALVAYHLDRCGMPLHDTVGVNSENGETTLTSRCMLPSTILAKG